jgi:hypothetical protein
LELVTHTNPISPNDGATLPNFIKIKHPRKGEKKKQGARTNDQASKQLKRRDGPQGGKGTTEHQTLHQSYEAYQLKRGEINPIKLQA